MLRIEETLQISRERATSVLHELRVGWKAFSSRRWLLISVGYFTLMFAFGFSVLRVLGPEVAKKSLGGPGAWAAISAITGVGAIAGGLLALRWKPTHPLRAAFTIGLFGAPLTLLLLGAHAALWVILLTALIEGVTGSFFNAVWFTAMQEEVPAEEISRVTSWDAVGSYALQPVGLALAGPIAEAIGVSTTLYAAGGIFLTHHARGNRRAFYQELHRHAAGSPRPAAGDLAGHNNRAVISRQAATAERQRRWRGGWRPARALS